MWQGVTSRKHKPLKIFPFGSNADELMLYGIVEFGLQNGKSLTADWGARAHLVKQGSEYKMDFYQVYTVRLALPFAYTCERFATSASSLILN